LDCIFSLTILAARKKQIMPTVNLIVKGKVQGVFFRAEAKEAIDGFEQTAPAGEVGKRK